MERDKAAGQVLLPAHDDKHPSLDIAIGDNGMPIFCCRSRKCDQKAIIDALRDLKLWPGSEIAMSPKKERGLGQIVAAYDYVDLDGEPRFQVVRFHPKDFRQRHPDGKGGWIWKLPDEHRYLPFRLPEVAEAVALEAAPERGRASARCSASSGAPRRSDWRSPT
jgi:hypothetical protein